jgi:hypothetical protein
MKTLPSRDRLSNPVEKGRERIDPKNIATREFSRNGAVALVDMTLPQLAEACDGLSRLEKEYENMSGICATLKGLVLIECKTKPELKGQFKSWVTKTFPKSYKSATRYMRLAEAFGRSDSTVTFQVLTQGLADSLEILRKQQLDLSHPIVARVAQWVNGRGAYQLMLDFPGQRGGARERKPPGDYDPNSPAEEARDLWLPHLRFLEEDGLDKCTWRDLPKAELDRLRSAILDLKKAMK